MVKLTYKKALYNFKSYISTFYGLNYFKTVMKIVKNNEGRRNDTIILIYISNKRPSTNHHVKQTYGKNPMLKSTYREKKSPCGYMLLSLPFSIFCRHFLLPHSPPSQSLFLSFFVHYLFSLSLSSYFPPLHPLLSHCGPIFISFP